MNCRLGRRLDSYRDGLVCRRGRRRADELQQQNKFKLSNKENEQSFDGKKR